MQATQRMSILEGQGMLQGADDPTPVKYSFECIETVVIRSGFPPAVSRRECTGSVVAPLMTAPIPDGFYRLFTEDNQSWAGGPIITHQHHGCPVHDGSIVMSGTKGARTPAPFQNHQPAHGQTTSMNGPPNPV